MPKDEAIKLLEEFVEMMKGMGNYPDSPGEAVKLGNFAEKVRNFLREEK